MRFTERYFIDEEKKVVVCKLGDYSNGLICDMCSKGWPGHDDLVIADVFTGKAKCSPDDEFNIEIGKKIAYKRAVSKIFRAKRRTLIDFMIENNKAQKALVRDTNNLIESYNKTINRKDDDILRIINTIENN